MEKEIKYKCIVCGRTGTEIELNRLGIDFPHDGCCGIGSLLELKVNNYYTPILQEFHIGFEFESYINKVWEKTILGGKTWADQLFLGQIIKDYRVIKENLDKYRVKYLDKKDIEELNWLYKRDNAGTEEIEFVSSDDKYWLEYDLESHYLRISFNEYEGDITRFSGIIKNKSELKKLMKQLGIVKNIQ